MKLRDVYLTKEETLPDSGTKVIDIDIKDPIIYFDILLEAQNGATSCIDHELHDDISKIEIVDGSDVLYSLSMMDAIALNYYTQGKLPYQYLTEVGGATQKESCRIYFGFNEFDYSNVFEAPKFTNPQIKISHALTVSATAGFESGTLKLTIRARVIEEGATPSGKMLMSKEIYSFTTAGSGEERIELPRDYNYRLLLVRALLSTYRPDEIFSKVKLTCDVDKFIPFELDIEHFMQDIEKRFGIAKQRKITYSADDDTVLTDIYDLRKAYGYCLTDDHDLTIEGLDAEQVSLGLLDLTTPGTPAWQTTPQSCVIDVAGLSVGAIIPISFGRLDEEREFFPATQYGKVELVLTQAQANASAAILLQQMR